MKSALFVAITILGVVYSEPPKNFEGYNYQRPTIAFVLPSRQQLPIPQNTYGAPQRFSARQTLTPPENTYGPPEDKYGPPPTDLTPPESLEVESRDVEGLTTTEMPTTTEIPQKETEQIRDVEETNEDEGIYYIYHPSGLLQRIVYSTKNDVKNMAYSAQFRYKDVEPIRDPIYTYDPETLVLRQILA